MMDKDRSNNITWEEFKTGIAMSGVRPLPHDGELRTLFASLDIDHSGGISFNELSAAFDTHLRPAGPHTSVAVARLAEGVACSRGFNPRYRE